MCKFEDETHSCTLPSPLSVAIYPWLRTICCPVSDSCRGRLQCDANREGERAVYLTSTTSLSFPTMDEIFCSRLRENLASGKRCEVTITCPRTPQPTETRSRSVKRTLLAPAAIHSAQFSSVIPPPTCRPPTLLRRHHAQAPSARFARTVPAGENHSPGHARSAARAASLFSRPRPSMMTCAPPSALSR